MLVTMVLLMGFGLPQDAPKQEATGTVPPGGGTVTFEIDKADPQNPTRGKVHRRALREGSERHPQFRGLPLFRTGT